MPHDVLLYWQRDAVALIAQSKSNEWVERRHQQLLRKSDVVTAVSPQLLQRTLDEGYDAALIPNGCDFDHFAAPRARPRDLPDNRLVIGFAGGVSDRIDVELLMSIVDARPEWLFVVAGEVVKTLPERPNLMVVGRQPYMEMPAWLQAFDIGVIPYVEDRRNLDSHPLKALEYLAAGVPVVSVPIEGLRSLAPVVQTASGPAAFLGKLDQLAADKPSAAECRNVARQHSWAARVDALEHLIAVELDTVRVH